MTEKLKTATAYLSVRTDPSGRRTWTVIARGSLPLCADTDEVTARQVARQHFGNAVLSIWDGDKGEFDDAD